MPLPPVSSQSPSTPTSSKRKGLLSRLPWISPKSGKDEKRNTLKNILPPVPVMSANDDNGSVTSNATTSPPSSPEEGRKIFSCFQSEKAAYRIASRRNSTGSLISTSTASKSDTPTVSFSTVEIHSHAVVLGDNPSVSSGPPVALGWDVLHSETYTLEAQPEEAPHSPRKKRGRRVSRRKSAEHLRITPDRREWMVRKQGHSSDSISRINTEVESIKAARLAVLDELRFQVTMKRLNAARKKRLQKSPNVLALLGRRKIQI